MAQERSYFRHADSSMILDLHPMVQFGRRSSTFALVPNRLYVQPFLTGRGGTLDQVGGGVFAATGSGTMRVAFYARTSASNLYPGALIMDAGSIDLSTTGFQSTSLTAVVSANDLWWCAAIADDNVTIFGTDDDGIAAVLGVDADFTTPTATMTLTHSFEGTWPATFPNSTTLTAGGVPAISLRYNG